MCECARYATLRLQILGQITLSGKELMKCKIQHICKFINQPDRFNIDRLHLYHSLPLYSHLCSALAGFVLTVIGALAALYPIFIYYYCFISRELR